MKNILKNFERSKEIVYIVNYIINNEMRIKEFKSMKSATTFARKCKNFRRLGARWGYDGLYHLCEARDLNTRMKWKQHSDTLGFVSCYYIQMTQFGDSRIFQTLNTG